jgi:hypothetical protein
MINKNAVNRGKALRNILSFVKTEEENTVATNAGGLVDKSAVYELVNTNTEMPCFALKIKGKPITYVKELKNLPHKLNVKPLAKVPWALATEPAKYKDTETLWNEVKLCLTEHVDLPEPEAYNALTAWVFASWQSERFQIAPYLFFFGTFGTGKTRCLEIISKLCSRGWLALYMTPACLYRPVESWKPTLFLDEAEIYGDKHEIIGLLNGSYRRGQFVCRQKENADEGGYETEFFDCFSFKAIAGTKELAKTLQSRCIIFRTSHATRKIKFFVDEKKCLDLRNKLLRWRFDTVLTEDTEGTEDSSKRLEALVEQIGNQREVELFYPLISVAPNREIEHELIAYAKTSASRKLEELSLTTEATCLSAILQAKEKGLMQNGRLVIQEITRIANENLSFEEHWKERFTSSLCARLGFQKSRGQKGKAVIIWSQPLVDRLRKDQRFALCFTHDSQPPSESSEPSVEQWEDRR